MQPPAEQALIATDVAHPAATLTQAPLHRANPLPHTNEHALLTHAVWALVTAVVHAWPHIEQSLALLVVSTQLPVQVVEAVEGHVAAHEYVPLDRAQRGVLPVHALPQLPQLAALEGSTQPSGHGSMPTGQVGSTGAASSVVASPASGGGVVMIRPASTHVPVHVSAE